MSILIEGQIIHIEQLSDGSYTLFCKGAKGCEDTEDNYDFAPKPSPVLPKPKPSFKTDGDMVYDPELRMYFNKTNTL